MYSISTDLYLEVRDQLFAEVGRQGYYSGSFDFEFGEVWCHMVLSAVIYNSSTTLPEGRPEFSIDDVVPVWWEFHTYINDEEVLNDFSFETLRGFIC